MNFLNALNAIMLFGDVAPRDHTLNGMGWTFMILSLAGVWTLAIYCYKKLLFDSE